MFETGGFLHFQIKKAKLRQFFQVETKGFYTIILSLTATLES